jgi:hypothetical protein
MQWRRRREWMCRFTSSWPPHWLRLVVSFTLLPHYTKGKSSRYHWIGGWISPRTGMDCMKNWKFFTLPRLELRSSVVQPLARHYTSCSTATRKKGHFLIANLVSLMLITLLILTAISPPPTNKVLQFCLEINCLKIKQHLVLEHTGDSKV